MCQIMIKQHCHRPQGNVMFSEAFVSRSVHRVGFPACITGHMTGGSASGGSVSRRGVCIQEGGLHPAGSTSRRGSASSGVCIQEVHPRDLHLGDLQPGGFLTARKRSLGQGNIFTCVCHSVHGGGVRGCGGVCGYREGMRGCWAGACIGHDEIGSMSGRYASYWNAFLFYYKISKKKIISFVPSTYVAMTLQLL